jgi:hypothetical protein
MKSVGELFDLWPSMADLGRDLDLPYSTVAAWKQRGSIPVAYWRGIIDAARKRGHGKVNGDLLVALHDIAPVVTSHLGFAEDAPLAETVRPLEENAEAGHFSRWKHLRRSHFSTTEEIAEHISALRSEWDRR